MPKLKVSHSILIEEKSINMISSVISNDGKHGLHGCYQSLIVWSTNQRMEISIIGKVKLSGKER
jgi:hypothetical protein